MKKIVLVVLLVALAASLVGQQAEFKIGASLGHPIDNKTQFANWDLNIVTNYDQLIVTMGVLIDERVNGWGRRFGIGANITSDISILGTWSVVDKLPISSHNSYGIDVSHRIFDGIHLSLGVETKRGIRVSIRYLKTK